ncbi:MAG: cytochrome c-type biogenesis protein CcmH [Alphaproteobacteria bacterium]
MTKLLYAAAVAALLMAGPALAVQPDEVLDDPALESRAREISKELRCLVCQNQSIDDSDAELAKDLRVLVRERLVEGDSDDEVMNFITDRYGDYVLLRPPINAGTALLWGGPFAIFLIAGITLAVWMRRRQNQGAGTPGQTLSDDEKARLSKLIDQDDKTA